MPQDDGKVKALRLMDYIGWNTRNQPVALPAILAHLMPPDAFLANPSLERVDAFVLWYLIRTSIGLTADRIDWMIDGVEGIPVRARRADLREALCLGPDGQKHSLRRLCDRRFVVVEFGVRGPVAMGMVERIYYPASPKSVEPEPEPDPERNRTPRRPTSYADYLASPEWDQRRKAALRRGRCRCHVCNASGVTLDVHHRTYERLGAECPDDLIVLCRECHRIFHEHGRLSR